MLQFAPFNERAPPPGAPRLTGLASLRVQLAQAHFAGPEKRHLTCATTGLGAARARYPTPIRSRRGPRHYMNDPDALGHGCSALPGSIADGMESTPRTPHSAGTREQRTRHLGA